MASYNYSGNNDFRGYIASNYKPLLGFVGNDGGINWSALNKAGGVDLYNGNAIGNHASYNTEGTAKLVNKLYKEWQGAYAGDLKSSASASSAAAAAAIAALNAQPKLPKFDYAGSYARAGNTAASTVNPVYQDKLNQYLEKARAALGQKNVSVTRNKEDIQTALAQALEDSATGRVRTTEDTENKLGDITSNENSFQRQEGRQFDSARTALLGDVANAGLTESGIGQGKVQDATIDRNLASEDEVRGFDAAKRDTELFRTRTLADLDKSDVREQAGSVRAKENQDIDLNNFIQNSNLEEKAFRSSNEYERINAVNAATQSAYQKIVAQTIASLSGSGARAQDIALFKQVYG